MGKSKGSDIDKDFDWVKGDFSGVGLYDACDPIEIGKDFTYVDLIEAHFNLVEKDILWRYAIAGKKMMELIRKNIDWETIDNEPAEFIEAEDGRMPENEIWLTSGVMDKNCFNPPEKENIIAIVKLVVKD